MLTQIVVEHAKDDHSAFPLDVLRQMVVASGRVTNEAALTYMRGVFDMYQNAYRAVSPVAPPHAGRQHRHPRHQRSRTETTPRLMP